jgi:hypothetical protein
VILGEKVYNLSLNVTSGRLRNVALNLKHLHCSDQDASMYDCAVVTETSRYRTILVTETS